MLADDERLEKVFYIDLLNGHGAPDGDGRKKVKVTSVEHRNSLKS